MTTITLNTSGLTLEDVVAVAREDAAIALHDQALHAMARSRAVVDAAFAATRGHRAVHCFDGRHCRVRRAVQAERQDQRPETPGGLIPRQCFVGVHISGGGDSDSMPGEMVR